jgi:hypothetical protein
MKAEFKKSAKTAKKPYASKTRKPRTTAEVAKLKAAVAKLSKISYDRVTMKMVSDNNISVVQPYYQYHLNQLMSTWSPIFGSNGLDISAVDKAYINSYKLDVRLSQDNEADRIYYSAFIVSLKDQGADSTTFDPATGALLLSDGVQFQSFGNFGRVMVNPKFFNIHAYKRFTMGGRSGDQSAPETRDLSFKIVPKNKLIVNPRGNVFQNASFNFPKDPSQNYYLLLFNDDAAGDLQTNKIYVGGLASVAIPS